jgi:hypothetical protein
MQTRHDPLPCGVSAQLNPAGPKQPPSNCRTEPCALDSLTNNVSADLMEWTRTPGSRQSWACEANVVELAEGARALVLSRFAQGCEEQTTDRQTDDSQLIRDTRPESKITCFHTLKDDVSASP